MLSKTKQSGFTLVEALVSVAIFAVVVSMAAVLFLAVSNAQRKATNQEKIMREVRQTMESLSRLVRMSTVVSGGGEQDILQLEDDNGLVNFWLDQNSRRIIYQRGDTIANFTGEDVDITNLQFFISPGADHPQTENWPTRVTILLTAARAGEYGSADVLKVQTTIVTRKEYD